MGRPRVEGVTGVGGTETPRAPGVGCGCGEVLGSAVLQSAAW